MLGGRSPQTRINIEEETESLLEKALEKEKERETPLGHRDTWWSLLLRPTPTPGTYVVRDFIEEAQLNPVKATYNFKGEGRKRPSIFQPTADLTLPDVYTYIPPSFVDLAGKKPATYSFKSAPRKSPSTLCFKDKDIDTAPGQYDLFPVPVPTFASKQFMFRSAVQRFPTTYFTPKEGPGPGEYEMKEKTPHPVSSCFQSKVPRLQPVRSKIPGPGAYEPTRQFPKQPRTIASLGHEHSIFFSNTFGF
ncbi:protein STPG4 isoform X2 [Mauremys mutica]|uniref:protein STPG4 isoform X2 n=1 Tax=Mauremys mutica TaxID=74926 RepID=UPI001D164088|nr:protein STPG4 isoform X2 [Mauremys mutica]